MAKHNYSKEMFGAAETTRRKNIEAISNSIRDRKLEIEALEYTIEELDYQINMGEKGFVHVKPELEYEKTEGWSKLLLKRAMFTRDIKQMKLDENKRILAEEEKGLAREQQRLDLILQGIPAWEDNEFKKHVQELQ